jgi:hypothetical protein
MDRAAGTSMQYVGTRGGIWNNTTDEITSLVFYADQANGIGVGSHIEVWARR